MKIINKPSPFGASYLDPSAVVVHCMGEYILFKGVKYHAVDYLYKMGWSAHAFVAPDEKIIRCREDNQGAYHAAAQEYNYKSLGIEFLVPGVFGSHNYGEFLETIKKPYLSEGQYNLGVEFCREKWVKEKGLLHFVEHSIIDPENKKDPGEGFPWESFLKDIGVIYR